MGIKWTLDHRLGYGSKKTYNNYNLAQKEIIRFKSSSTPPGDKEIHYRTRQRISLFISNIKQSKKGKITSERCSKVGGVSLLSFHLVANKRTIHTEGRGVEIVLP